MNLLLEYCLKYKAEKNVSPLINKPLPLNCVPLLDSANL